MVFLPHPHIDFAGKERVRRDELSYKLGLWMMTPLWKLLCEVKEEENEKKNIGFGSGPIYDLCNGGSRGG
jgi:hypothetical protein